LSKLALSLFSLSLVALPCTSSRADAGAPAQAIARHKDHAKLHAWRIHLSPEALKKIEGGAKELLKLAEGSLPGGKVLEAALGAARKLLPKADPSRIEHAAALALHHATEVLHGQIGGHKLPAGASAAAAKADQKIRDVAAKHEELAGAIEKLMQKIGPGKPEQLTDLK
jgi:hypothetical protein